MRLLIGLVLGLKSWRGRLSLVREVRSCYGLSKLLGAERSPLLALARELRRLLKRLRWTGRGIVGVS